MASLSPVIDVASVKIPELTFCAGSIRDEEVRIHWPIDYMYSMGGYWGLATIVSDVFKLLLDENGWSRKGRKRKLTRWVKKTVTDFIDSLDESYDEPNTISVDMGIEYRKDSTCRCRLSITHAIYDWAEEGLSGCWHDFLLIWSTLFSFFYVSIRMSP